MHLIPADRADQRIIDGEQVCQAIAALSDPASVRTLAQHFAVLADPTRLMLLICIRAAGPISVSDLAVAIKPYPVLFLPYLLIKRRATAAVVLTICLAIAVAVPAAVYGWNGNYDLLQSWARTLSDSTQRPGPGAAPGESVGACGTVSRPDPTGPRSQNGWLPQWRKMPAAAPRPTR